MDTAGVDGWFAAYLEDFAAVARGQREVQRLLQWYSVPLVITVDEGTMQMTTADDVLAVVGNQVDQLKVEGFIGSVEVHGETTLLNGSSAMRHEGLVRRRADGTDIDDVEMTYVIVAIAGGFRIALMAVRKAVPTE